MPALLSAIRRILRACTRRPLVFALGVALFAILPAFTSAPLAVAAPGHDAPAVREGAVREGAVREGAVREGAVREGAVREGDPLQLGEVPVDYSTHDEGWIVFRYHPSLSAQVRRLAGVAEEAKADLERLLGRPVLHHVTVRVGRTSGEMETLAPRGGRYPRYAAGVAYSSLGLVLLSAEPKYPGERHDLVEIFRHELAHVALYDAVGENHVPRWFNEGFAVHASGEAETSRVQALWTATLAERLIPLAALDANFPEDGTTANVAYAQAADVIRFLLRGGQEHRFVDLLDRLTRGQAFEAALSDAYSTDLPSLEEEWRRDVARRYTFWPVLFGGSMVWIVAIGLFGWGYVRRRQSNRKRLDQWAREEAAEDARRALARAVLSQSGPVRVVLAEVSGRSSGMSPSSTSLADERAVHPAFLSTALSVPEVPKVEHEGGWHTLH